MGPKTAVAAVAIALAVVGCGGGGEEAGNENLVPQGMRRTSVTADSVPAAPLAEAEAPVDAAADAYVVQAGAFRDPAAARRQVERLAGTGIESRIEAALVDGTQFHRVIVTGFTDRASADATAARIERELGTAAVVRTP